MLELGADLPAGGVRAAFDSAAVAALAEPERLRMLEAFAAALQPVFFIAAGASALAFGLSFWLRELPLSNVLRKESSVVVDAT